MKRCALILNGEDVHTHGTYVITHYTVWYSLVHWSVGLDCFLTTTEPLQSSFSIEPRPPRSGDLGPIVLAQIRARLPCSHMTKRTELRGGNVPGSETTGQVWKHPYCICTQYLVGAPFALITVSMRRGMEVISLWHCWGGMEAQVALIAAFRSSALLGLVSLIFLLTIPHRFSMGFRSGEFAGQSSTVTPWSLNQLLVPLAVWAGAKSCWKMKSASP